MYVVRAACAIMVHAFVSLCPNSFFLTKLLLQVELILSVVSLSQAHPTSQPYLFSHSHSHQSSHHNNRKQGIGQITLQNWRQVNNLSCSRQSGLYGQNPAQGRQASTPKALLLKVGRPPRFHISLALCSPTDRQLCRRISLNGQPNYYVCNLRGYTCALRAQPFSIIPYWGR